MRAVEFPPSQRHLAIAVADRLHEPCARFAEFSSLRMGVIETEASRTNAFSSGTARGVIVTTCLGEARRRKSNCSMPQVSFRCAR